MTDYVFRRHTDGLYWTDAQKSGGRVPNFGSRTDAYVRTVMGHLIPPDAAVSGHSGQWIRASDHPTIEMCPTFSLDEIEQAQQHIAELTAKR